MKAKEINLSEKTKKALLEKHNKGCNTKYQMKDVQEIITYKYLNKNIDIIQITFNDYTCQMFEKDTLEICNFI